MNDDATYLAAAFSEVYLKAIRRSDLEIVSDMLARDIKVAQILPRDQRIALSHYVRDLADRLERMEDFMKFEE